MGAYRIMHSLYTLIDAKRLELEGFKVKRPPLSLLRNLASVQVAAIHTISELESKKHSTLGGMKANIAKMKRLHEQAYGN